MNAGKRAVVVELVGPAGVGKSTLLQTLVARRPETRLLSLWGLPRPVLLASGTGLLTAHLAAALHGRPIRPAEGGQMVRLEALARFIERLKAESPQSILLDEGPVFGLSWLDVFYGRGDRVRASWRRRAVARWAAHLDAIVRVDAADPVIAWRIRARSKPHLIKHSSDAEIYGFGARFRTAFDAVIGEIQNARAIPVLHLRTDVASMTECASVLEQALDRLSLSKPASLSSTAPATAACAVATS